METTLTSKGQMTLPHSIRKRMGLQAGDKLSVSLLDDDTIVLKRPVARPISRLRGLLPQPEQALGLDAMDAGVVEHLRRKHSE